MLKKIFKSSQHKEYINKLMERIDDDSFKVRKKVVEEIEILYLKNKDDFLAHAYILSLLKLSQLQDVQEVYETTKIADGIYKNHKTFEVAYIYSDLLYRLSIKASKDIVAENLEKIKEIYKAFPCDEISIYLFLILPCANVSLAIESKNINNELIEAEKILEKHKTDLNIKHYVNMLCDICSRPDVDDTLVYINKIKEYYSLNSELAEYYSSSLVKEAGNEDNRRAFLAITELEKLYNTYKTDYTTKNYGFGLCNITVAGETKQCVESIEKIEALQNELEREDFITMYTESLRNLSTHDNEKYNDIIKEKLIKLYNNEQNDKIKEDIGLKYCMVLYNILTILSVEQQIINIIEILKKCVELQSTEILYVYRTAITDVCKRHKKEDLVFIIEKLKMLVEEETIDIDICSDFFNAYTWIIKDNKNYEQETDGENTYGITNEQCIENVEYLFEKYENEKMAESYIFFTSNYVDELDSEKDIRTAIDKVEKIYQTYKNKDTAIAISVVFYMVSENEYFENYKYGYNFLEKLYNEFEIIQIAEAYLRYISSCMRFEPACNETFVSKAESLYNTWKDSERAEYFETNYIISYMEYYTSLEGDKAEEVFEIIKDLCSKTKYTSNKELYESFLNLMCT